MESPSNRPRLRLGKHKNADIVRSCRQSIRLDPDCCRLTVIHGDDQNVRFLCLRPRNTGRTVIAAMTDIANLETLEARAVAAGLSIRQWLLRAGVAQSTFYRAKRTAGARMQVPTLIKLAEAIPAEQP